MKNLGIILLVGFIVMLVVFKWQENKRVIDGYQHTEDSQVDHAKCGKSSPSRLPLNESFDIFFDTFKSRLLQKDRQYLQSIVLFPLRIKKREDDPQIEYLPDSIFFHTFLEKYLNHRSICPCNSVNQEKWKTIYSCDEKTRSLDDYRKQKGDFLFTYKNNSWQLEELLTDLSGTDR